MIAFRSVHSRFLACLVPLFVLSFLLLTSITYHMASDALLQEGLIISKCVGSEIALQVQLGITNVQMPLRLVAGRETVRSGDEEQILPVLAQIKEMNPIVNQAFYLHPDGRMLRADGVILDRSSREYFQHVMKTHQPYISKPIMGETTKKMQVMVLQPVMDGERLTGILMAAVYIDNLARMTERMELTESARSYIVDGDGMVIGCNRDPGVVGKLDFLHRDLEGDEAIDPEVSDAFRAAIGTGQQTYATYRSSTGMERLATFTPFGLSDAKWAIVSSVSSGDVNAPIRHLLIVISMVFLVVLVISVGIIFYFADTITMPLEELAREFRKIDGQNSLDAVHGRQDEIGVLAKGIERIRDLNDKSQHYEKKASFDELTGLLNRYGFKQRVEESMQACAGQNGIIVLADLDHLKHINDYVGHAAGDDAISTAADLLRQAFGSDAVIGRIGGDEFILFACIGTGEFHEDDIAVHVKELSRQYNETSGKPYYVDLSLGMINFVCSEEANIAELMKEADRGLYEAKKSRRMTSLRNAEEGADSF